MPKVTIDGRTLEVEAGTNLVDVGHQAGVSIPHYCYHPRLSVVGQCRMCLVEVEMNGKKMPKLQAGCSTQVSEGMVIRTDTPEVKEAQKGMMEFLLINHPLDCPICDQAGECGLQDYSFQHGVATSRFPFEDKRTYPERERIPLGPTVLLNMNRCIQCTRCVRFTHEIAGTGELGFFNRGSRAEIGTFPGKELDNPLSTCVVDVCPVGALTSTRFRFAERVFNLDKKASICNGCDAGCNVTIEHRRGKIRRLKPRLNPAVNDYWMCDFGRATWERWRDTPRLATPTVSGRPSGWKEALDTAYQILRGRMGDGAVAVLGSGFLSNEEAYLFAQLADLAGASHRGVAVDASPERKIPNPHGGVVGREAAPNRRGAEMAGLGAKSKEDLEKLLEGAHTLSALVVADSDFGAAAWDPEVVAKLRKARGLVVFGWADSPLAKAADVALPVAAHPERDGSFVNSQNRIQRAEVAFPPPAQVRTGIDVLTDLLARFDATWGGSAATAKSLFEKMAAEIPALSGVSWKSIGTAGASLASASTEERAR